MKKEAAINNAYDATLAFFQMPEERLKYLNRQMAIMDYHSGLEAAEARGEARGEKRGEARGVKRGEDRTAQLFERLHAARRDEEAFRAMSDAVLRENLFREFRL